MMGEFIKRFNDYSCIEKNDTSNIVYLSHYTSCVEAAKNICSGEFRATDIKDFNDKLEGRLILERVKEIILEENVFSKAQSDCLNDLIGDDNRIDEFLGQCRTSVLSMCLNTDSKYLWKNYAGKDGYNIIFYKNALVDSIYFCTADGQRKDKVYIKHAPIVYNTDEQIKIIKKEIGELMKNNEPEFCDAEKIKYILRHLMYVGNFYKDENNSTNRYVDEQEYRFLINTAVPPKENSNITDKIPEYYHNLKNGQHYNILKFDKKAIKAIVCNSRRAKENITNIITDIPITLRKNKGVTNEINRNG